MKGELTQAKINKILQGGKALPAGLTSVGGSLYLEGYQHPLPAGLTSVGGYLYLEGYQHPLPAGLRNN